MTQQQVTRADTGDNSQQDELHRPIGRGLLKLLAWPAVFYGAGFVLFLAVYALQLAGVL